MLRYPLSMAQKIVPHLWFNNQAVEAAEFYTTVFPQSHITLKTNIANTPSGDCDIVGFSINGFEFMSISAGPYFNINPSISFSVNLRTKDEAQALWNKLVEGGTVLMPLQSYPFSDCYGWLNDQFGISWQIIALGNASEGRPFITPALMFTKEHAGKAEQAMEFYTRIFDDSQINNISRYETSEGPDAPGTIAHAEFMLTGQEFMALDSAAAHEFVFNEAVSFIINCKDQEEIDYYWEKLSAVPQAQQCGWLKDKFGVSWQIMPVNMGELMGKNPAKTTPVMLSMKKIIIADLKKAGEGAV